MFRTFLLSIIAALSLSAQAAETPLNPATLFIAGDSTAATYTNADHQGWGAVFGEFFDSKNITIDNRARGGRSTRTFISEGWWQTLVDDIQPGDVVLIQFGHNDASPVNDDRRARGTLPGTGEDFTDIHNLLTDKDERVYSFGHYLRQMIADVRGKQGVPVLLSLTARNIWQHHRIERGSGNYGYWSREVAWHENTPFIDLTNAAADALEAMGPQKTAQLYQKDHTHYTTEGARLHARLIVSALKGLRPTLDAKVYSEAGAKVTAYDWTFLRLPVVADKTRRSVFMVGDSTVRNGWGDGRDGQWGWGDYVQDYLPEGRVNIVNRAVGGLSSRTFVTGGHWQRALNMMQPGDIVLIQFGHNDAAPLNDDTRARGTIRGVGYEVEDINNMLTGLPETVHSYGWYLRKMISDAKARGVIPVICSPVPRKTWQDDLPRIKRAKDSYPQWAEYVARESQTAFIDLHQLVANEYDQLGPVKVDALFADAHTHTSKAGAVLTASVVAERLRAVLGW